MKVFVAGSSREPGRVRAAFDAVRAAGHEVALDWLAVIDAHDGRANEGLTEYERIVASNNDLQAIRESNLFWYLLPEGEDSKGARTEFGYALAHIHVITSGNGREQSIFTSKAWKHCDTDAEAASLIRGMR